MSDHDQNEAALSLAMGSAIASITELRGENKRIQAEYGAYFEATKKRESHLQACISHEVDKRQAQVRELTTLHAREIAALRAERDRLKADNERLRGLLSRIVNTGHLPTCFRLKPDPSCPRCEAVRDAFKELGR